MRKRFLVEMEIDVGAFPSLRDVSELALWLECHQIRGEEPIRRTTVWTSTEDYQADLADGFAKAVTE